MTDANPEPPPPTRGSTRALARAAQEAAETATPPVSEMPMQPLLAVAVVALAGLLTVTAFAGPAMVALALALAAGVIAWGWCGLLGLPSPRGTSLVLALGSAAAIGTVLATTEDPYLVWLPAAMAGAMIVAFIHQLARRDGRPRLVESIASTVTAIAVVVSGASLVALPRTEHGAWVVAIASAAVAVSALTDLAAGSRRFLPWLLPLAMFAGGVAAVAVGHRHRGDRDPATARPRAALPDRLHRVREAPQEASFGGEHRDRVVVEVRDVHVAGFRIHRHIGRVVQGAGFPCCLRATQWLGYAEPTELTDEVAVIVEHDHPVVRGVGHIYAIVLAPRDTHRRVEPRCCPAPGTVDGEHRLDAGLRRAAPLDEADRTRYPEQISQQDGKNHGKGDRQGEERLPGRQIQTLGGDDRGRGTVPGFGGIDVMCDLVRDVDGIRVGSGVPYHGVTPRRLRPSMACCMSGVYLSASR